MPATVVSPLTTLQARLSHWLENPDTLAETVLEWPALWPANPVEQAKAMHLVLQLAQDHGLLEPVAPPVGPPPPAPAFVLVSNRCELTAAYPPDWRPAGLNTPQPQGLTREDWVAFAQALQPHQAVTVACGLDSALRVPGLHHPSLMKQWERLLTTLREWAPDSVQLTASSLEEVAMWASVDNRPQQYALDLLRAHGVHQLGGFHGQPLVADWRRKANPKLQRVDQWLSLCRLAHQRGLQTVLGLPLWPTVSSATVWLHGQVLAATLPNQPDPLPLARPGSIALWLPTVTLDTLPRWNAATVQPALWMLAVLAKKWGQTVQGPWAYTARLWQDNTDWPEAAFAANDCLLTGAQDPTADRLLTRPQYDWLCWQAAWHGHWYGLENVWSALWVANTRC